MGGGILQGVMAGGAEGDSEVEAVHSDNMRAVHSALRPRLRRGVKNLLKIKVFIRIHASVSLCSFPDAFQGTKNQAPFITFEN